MDRFLGQKTVFIGGGRMGEAIFSGLLSNGILKADDLTVLDVYAPRREGYAGRKRRNGDFPVVRRENLCYTVLSEGVSRWA